MPLRVANQLQAAPVGQAEVGQQHVHAAWEQIQPGARLGHRAHGRRQLQATATRHAGRKELAHGRIVLHNQDTPHL